MKSAQVLTSRSVMVQAALSTGLAAAVQAAPAAALAAAQALAEAAGLGAGARPPAPSAPPLTAPPPQSPFAASPGASPDAPPAKRKRGDPPSEAAHRPGAPEPTRVAGAAGGNGVSPGPEVGSASENGGSGGRQPVAATEALAQALAAGRGRVGVVHLAVHADDTGAVAAWGSQLEAVAEPSARHAELSAFI